MSHCQRNRFLWFRSHRQVRFGLVNLTKPRPQGLFLVQNGGRRNPWPRLPKWLQKFVRISSRKHDEMSSFCLNNGFRSQKTNRAARHWKQRPKKPFYHVSRDKMLLSISAALARGFSDRHFERGEGPGDEVEPDLILVPRAYDLFGQRWDRRALVSAITLLAITRRE